RDDDLVALVDRRHQRVVEHLLAAGADDDLLRRVVEAVLALELGGHRLLELGRAVDRGVFGVAAPHGGDRRLLDVGGRVEIGLAGREADDVAPGRLHLERPLGHGEGGRRLDAQQAGGDQRHDTGNRWAVYGVTKVTAAAPRAQPRRAHEACDGGAGFEWTILHHL